MTVLNGTRSEVVLDLASRARAALAQVQEAPADPAGRRDLLQETAAQIVRSFQAERLQAGADMLGDDEASDLAADLVRRLQGPGRLQALLADATVRDVWCEGWDVVWVLRTDGTKERVAPFADSDTDLVALVVQLAADAAHATEQERRFDPSAPILDLQLEDGSRLNAAAWVCKRPSLSIRKRRKDFKSLNDLVASGMITEEVREFLTAVVRSKCNCVVAGPTGAGKTTLVRALADVMRFDEHLITIEDVYELGLDEDTAHHGIVTAFQAREANGEGAGAVSMDALLKCALRKSPDRILVGEVRGEEAVTMLEAMSKGDRGSLSTIHAESSLGAINMLTLQCLKAQTPLTSAAAARLIGLAVNVIVVLEMNADGVGYVAAIREITGSSNETPTSNELWEPGPDRRAQWALWPSHDLARRLAQAGWQGVRERGLR
ncbi:CpaF family protein [Glycomyces sp. MUSA5-2]|uniref:CpaF family protein n=1 Tax=Glycomyces sp. MUSA5-2 TaxID=2053002 RepID=UPI00300AACFC